MVVILHLHGASREERDGREEEESSPGDVVAIVIRELRAALEANGEADNDADNERDNTEDIPEVRKIPVAAAHHDLFMMG